MSSSEGSRRGYWRRLRRSLSIRWPGRDEALGRLDRDAPLAHRPASGLEDKLANDAADAETRALWELHRARLAEQVATLSTAPPSPRMAWRDPRALRYAAVLLALAAGLLAGPERYPRILAAFDGRGGGSGSSPPRIDAWIDPPDYTNKPPLLLKVAGQQASETVVAPEDSVLVMRAEAKEIDARVEGGIAPAAAPAGPGDKSGDKSVDKSGSSAARAPFERRFVIHGDGRFTVLRNGSPLATFEIHATALGKPTISLIDPPQANVAGSLTLHYSISDAYGLAGAEAGVRPARKLQRLAKASTGRTAEIRPLLTERSRRRGRSADHQRSLRASLGRS